MFIACFSETGRCLAISDGVIYPDTEYTAEVPMGTNPSHIYYDVDKREVVQKEEYKITVARNLISGIPQGTELRIYGGPLVTVESESFAFTGEAEGSKWVRLSHPLFIDWSGNVPVGP